MFNYMYFNQLIVLTLREAAKKVIFLMAGPLKPNPPPPELNGRRNFCLVLK